MVGGPADGGLPVRGVARAWQGRPDVGSPDPTLVSMRGAMRWQSVELTILLVLVLLLAWVLSSRPTLRPWVQIFWPEQLALLGCLGWQILGTTPLPLALVAVGLSARLLSLARRPGSAGQDTTGRNFGKRSVCQYRSETLRNVNDSRTGRFGRIGPRTLPPHFPNHLAEVSGVSFAHPVLRAGVAVPGSSGGSGAVICSPNRKQLL